MWAASKMSLLPGTKDFILPLPCRLVLRWCGWAGPHSMTNTWKHVSRQWTAGSTGEWHLRDRRHVEPWGFWAARRALADHSGGCCPSGREEFSLLSTALVPTKCKSKAWKDQSLSMAQLSGSQNAAQPCFQEGRAIRCPFTVSSSQRSWKIPPTTRRKINQATLGWQRC